MTTAARARRIAQRLAWAAPIFLVALVVRVLYVLSVHDAYFFHRLQTEPLRYSQWATLILAHRPPAPPFDEPPGYPYFVAATYAVFGRNVTAVALVQTVIDAATCALVALVGRRWFGPRVGFIAGVLAAFYGPLVYFTGEVEPATVFVFTVMLAIAAASAGVGSLLVGSLWALSTVVRAEIFVALPIVLGDAWRRGRGRAVAGVAAPVALLLAIFVGLNAAHAKEPILFTTGGGLNLWLGNNPRADGVTPFISDALAPTMTAVSRRATDAAQADAIFARKALARWRRAPREAAALAWKKFVWTWTDRELPNTADIDWQTAHSWLFRSRVFPLPLGAILPFAVAGAFFLRRRWSHVPLLLAPLAIAVVTSVVFFTNARFRLVMVPSLVLLAAVGVERIGRMRRPEARTVFNVSLAATGIAIGLVVAWGGFYGVGAYEIPEITVNTGIVEREAGNFSSAVRLLRAGLAESPRDTIAWNELALALEQEGDVRAALATHLDALARVPEDASVRVEAVRFFQRHGLDRTALARYLTAPGVDARRAIADALVRDAPPAADQ